MVKIMALKIINANPNPALMSWVIVGARICIGKTMQTNPMIKNSITAPI
jgi:hypothetical protein